MNAQEPHRPESESTEYKSTFVDSPEDWAMLVKTIVAMANTEGGCIVLEAVACRFEDLDSARLDDKVNKYVEPRVSAITSQRRADGGVEVRVAQSHLRPHVFRCDFAVPGDKGKAFFYPGQVWVRHSSKNGPAAAEDFERMIQSRFAKFLQLLSVRIAEPGGIVTIASDGLRVCVTDDPSAPHVYGDMNKLYPYTATEAGKLIDRGAQWFSRAAKVLGLRGDPRYWSPMKIGSCEYHKYNDLAVDLLRRKVEAEPTWSPFTTTR